MFTRRFRSPARLLAASAAIVAGQSALQADAGILYGDFSDIPPGTVTYVGVEENSASDPVPPPLYGAPTISGDVLDFNPVNLNASTVGAAPGADITEAQLNFTVEANAGSSFTFVEITESGVFTLIPPASGTDASSVSAGIFAQVDITHLNGTLLPQSIIANGTIDFAADLVASPGANQPWSLQLVVDLNPALVNAGFDPQVDLITQADVVINNTLVAVSETNPDTTSTITKTDFTVNVPEPGSLALLALGGFFAVPRRRR